MGLISQGSGVLASAARGVVAATRAVLQTLLEAALFAAVVALLVWLLPGKLPVAFLSLYGLICVWLLQLGAVSILLLTLVRAPFSAEARGDVVKAVVICGGFLIVVALCNAYILALAQAWGRDFGVPVDHIPLKTFLTADKQIFGMASSACAAAIAFVDRIAVAQLHLSQPPLQSLGAISVAFVSSALPSTNANDPIRSLALGTSTGLLLAIWRRLARSQHSH